MNTFHNTPEAAAGATHGTGAETTPAASPTIRPADLVLLLVPPLFWAGNFVVGRAMRDDLPPFTMSFLRWLIACAVILPFAWPRLRQDRGFYRAHPWRMAGLALTGVVAFNSLVYLGLHSTSAANGLLLNSTIPVLIMLLGAVFYGQALRREQAAGLALSLAGIVLIVVQADLARLAALRFSTGDLVVFTGMIAWAFYTLWLRQVPRAVDRVGLLGAQILLALPVLALMALGEVLLGLRPRWTPHSIAALVYIGIFPSVLAYLAYNLGVARVGPTVAGLSIHLIPVFGIVLAVTLLDESFHLYHVAGMALILAGLALASGGWRRRKA